MKIVHIVERDKFSSAWINYFKINFPDIIHYFMVRDNGNEEHPLNLVDNKNLILTPDYYIWFTNETVKKIMYDADKIIVSGVFSTRFIFCNYDEVLYNKTYIQFWGGDFYDLRDDMDDNGNVKSDHNHWYLNCLQRCYAYIFPYYNDVQAFENITKIKKHHYIVAYFPVPADDGENKLFSDLQKSIINDDKKNKRIIVGNSATKTNCHIEIFNKLSKYDWIHELEIICPLSYGNEEEYRDYVIKVGYEKFGNKFKPITEYISLTKYIELLNSCDVGVFNNNRQQGGSTIVYLTRLGKKVYIRDTISTYQSTKKDGYAVFPISDITSGISLNNFLNMDNKDRIKNIKLFEEKYKIRLKQWKVIFDERIFDFKI